VSYESWGINPPEGSVENSLPVRQLTVAVGVGVQVEGYFIWNEEMQGIILSAFFYGYVTTQIAGGLLAHKVGGKRPLLFGIFWTSLLTTLTPLFTRLGDFAAIVSVRILEGIGEVRVWPSFLGHTICNF